MWKRIVNVLTTSRMSPSMSIGTNSLAADTAQHKEPSRTAHNRQ